jgi:hypothetical protein
MTTVDAETRAKLDAWAALSKPTTSVARGQIDELLKRMTAATHANTSSTAQTSSDALASNWRDTLAELVAVDSFTTVLNEGHAVLEAMLSRTEIVAHCVGVMVRDDEVHDGQNTSRLSATTKVRRQTKTRHSLTASQTGDAIGRVSAHATLVETVHGHIHVLLECCNIRALRTTRCTGLSAYATRVGEIVAVCVEFHLHG